MVTLELLIPYQARLHLSICFVISVVVFRVSFVPCYTMLCWLMLCFYALLTWTAHVFLGNWLVKLWSDPTYHTSFFSFRYDVTLKESTHTDHIYGLHAPNMPHQGYQSNIRQLSYFLISGCRGPISTMPHAYYIIYVYTSKDPTSIRFWSCAKSLLYNNKSRPFKLSVLRVTVQYKATPP